MTLKGSSSLLPKTQIAQIIDGKVFEGRAWKCFLKVVCEMSRLRLLFSCGRKLISQVGEYRLRRGGLASALHVNLKEENPGLTCGSPGPASFPQPQTLSLRSLLLLSSFAACE